MGNRAVIATECGVNGVGVYLHWNGGVESVLAFCQYCKTKGYRPPNHDSYGWARLCQVVGNYFNDGLSVGIGIVKNLDYTNTDNGLYVIKDWEIVGHYMWNGNTHDFENIMYLRSFRPKYFRKMMVDINHAMPEADRLTLNQLIKAIRNVTGYPCRIDWGKHEKHS